MDFSMLHSRYNYYFVLKVILRLERLLWCLIVVKSNELYSCEEHLKDTYFQHPLTLSKLVCRVKRVSVTSSSLGL